MTSIRTNGGALTALQTLRSISSNLGEIQDTAASGLRVKVASDNAAYWSISTTMRSDKAAVSVVSDALGLGAAKVDTAYAGVDAVIDVLGNFKAKLVAASEEGVDKSKIQQELDQMKDQVVSIATSASFSGQNWLNTDVEEIQDDDTNKVSVVSSFVRDAAGGVSVKQSDLHLSRISLFNSTGGGLLQRDNRDIGTIGGIRAYSPEKPIFYDSTAYYTEDESGWMYPSQTWGSVASFSFSFPDDAPLDFNAAGAEISFNLVLDKEASNPQGYTGADADLQELPGPYYDGYETPTITITKADVDAYDPSLGGIIKTNKQFAAILNRVIGSEGAYVSASYSMYDPPGSGNWVHDPSTMSITTQQLHGDGSYVEIANLSSTNVSTGGLKESSAFGTRGSGLALDFEPFIVHIDGEDEDGVSVNFDFSVNGEPAKSYSFDRTYVNTLLGKDTGKVETSEEMATLLHSLLDTDWPGLVIDGTTFPGQVIVKSDPTVDRGWGTGTKIDFNNIRVSNEPLPALSFLNIDVEQHPDMLENYINYIELVSKKVTDAGAALGSLQSRIDLQSDFSAKLMQSIDQGVGRLVDADMDETSNRLSAMQTQQQLALQALSIANASSSSLLTLFR